jgi:hypothetical protein
MRTLLAVSAAVMLATGTAQAASEPKAQDLPGFKQMDKNDDGELTRAEAGGNPELLARFGEVDGDRNGAVSRYEYWTALAKEEFRSLRERVADWIEPGGTASPGAGR